ncbi:SapC family protein [Echinimonas agarilytica]|uniref:SapC family protein n=1 Tax=Echinimonas agarilytica TaxID=1215918 RepID=A0AA41W673_9GAMM|nr:SapC family protein [Echinimonas agarilytica]MCM2679368.1 SapC family protein [Echinimonas agarilytica]
MSQIETIDPVKHAMLKIDLNRNAHGQDEVHIVDVVPNEFRHLMGYFPILFTKDATTGSFIFAAIMGFQAGENLLLEGHGWDVPYVPLNIARRPFTISVSDKTNDKGETVRVPSLGVEVENPRVGTGNALFSNGEATDALKFGHQKISQLITGLNVSRSYIERLSTLQLITPLNIKITLVDGHVQTFDGLYTIDEDKFRALPTDEIVAMHKSGLLESVYMMIGSLSQLGNLVKRKNQRLSTGT